MTPSDRDHADAEEIIDQVAGLLDEEYMASMIDQPIDRACEQFLCDGTIEYSHRRFHETIAAFFQRLHKAGIANRESCAMPRSHDEAVALLEHAYQGTYSDGYYAAVQDAADPLQAGTEVVVARIADVFKVRRREGYVRWVITRHIDPLDWEMKCKLVAVLIGRCYEWLPASLRSYRPDQLVDTIPELLTIWLAASSQCESLELPF